MMTDGFEVRPTEEADLDDITALEAKLFSMPWSRQGFSDALANPCACLWTAREKREEGGRLLGYLCMYVSIDEGEITNVATDPEFRRRGVGRALLAAAMAEAEDRDLEQIVLEVRQSNEPAISLYEKRGFISLGIRKNFYERPREDAVIMAFRREKC